MTTLEYLEFALSTAIDVYRDLRSEEFDASRREHIFNLQRRVREERKRERAVSRRRQAYLCARKELDAAVERHWGQR